MARSPEDPLVAQLFDGKREHAEIARAIEQLTPEEAAYFLHKLEAAYRKRKIQLSGYLVAMVAWLVGMTMALVYFGMNDLSSAWAFLVPFGIVGVILYAFGAWADRVGRAPPPQRPQPPGSTTSP
ncbi:MAG TPA: hypothetical protein VIX73_38765 [Kofleriaceae bacterium]